LAARQHKHLNNGYHSNYRQRKAWRIEKGFLKIAILFEKQNICVVVQKSSKKNTAVEYIDRI
jgi:hypothetical protein